MTYQRRRFKKENDKPETPPASRRRRLPFGECPSCDRDRAEGPSHDPSPHCESGSHPHCTCDTCF
jgi:hypothetical protein